MPARALSLTVLALVAAPALSAVDGKTQYEQRAAERDLALFAALDRDRDGNLSREEARGDLTLGPRFDDADINRDGIVTRAEIERYLVQRYGLQPGVAAR